jgi:hypothetical protein
MLLHLSYFRFIQLRIGLIQVLTIHSTSALHLLCSSC